MIESPPSGSVASIEHPAPAHAAVPGQRTWAAMRLPAFRLYWWSSMGHMGAMNVQMLVQPWFMYELTRSPAMLGLASLVNALPMLALSPIGGYLADRYPKKTLLFIGQAASGVLTLVIAGGISLGLVGPVALLIGAACQGALMAFTMPARQAIVREIVDIQDLGNALALSNAGQNINRLMAPALTGALIGAMGAASGYYTMTALYLVALVLTAQLPKTAIYPSRDGFLTQIGSGLSYVRHDRTILMVLLVSLGGVILAMPYIALLPVFAKDVLNVGPEKLGLLMTVSGGGAVVASLGLATIDDRNRGRLYLASMLLLGIALAAFALSPTYVLAMVFIVPIGMAQAVRMALSNIIIQAYVEDAYRGRVMSLFMMEFGLTSLSTFGVALVAEAAGVNVALFGTGVVLAAFAVCVYVFVPRLRRLD